MVQFIPENILELSTKSSLSQATARISANSSTLGWLFHSLALLSISMF
jgi:hypothetical protein